MCLLRLRRSNRSPLTTVHQPDPDGRVEAAVAGRFQRVVHQGQEKQGQGVRPGKRRRVVLADRQAVDGAGVLHKNLSSF